MEQFLENQVVESRKDLKIRVFEDCIIYQGAKFKYQLSESYPDLGLETVNILLDGASHPISLMSPTFDSSFIAFFDSLPPQYKKQLKFN